MTLNLERLEERLKVVKLPPTIRLDEASLIVDVPKFFDSHIAMLRSPVANEKTKKIFEARVVKAGLVIREYNKPKK